MKLLIAIVIFVFVFLSNANASFISSWQAGYSSHSENKTNLAFNDMTNHFFLGAGIGSKEQLFFGQNISSVTEEYKTPNSTKISTLDLGPRINWYFNDEKTILVHLAWNPYAKGTRVSSGASSDISGWSYLVGFGYELKITKNFYMGGSINYRNLSVTKSELNNVSTTESTSYTSITPMLNLSFRFR